MGKSKGKMKKMSRQQQKAVGASMAESGINMNAQQIAAQPAQQMTNIPPAPANTLGQAQPVFNQQAQQAAQGIYGGVEQRQNAVGATPMFQKNQLGNTKEEQAKINSANKIKQEKFPEEYNNYKKAVYAKKEWDETENDFGFAGKEYPGQKTLDSLRTVYKNKKY